MDNRNEILSALTSGDKRTGIVMDFDGVLSPIVDDPGASRLLDGVLPALERLAARLDVVALLSGRPVAFLAERVPVPGAMLLGSYGLERRIEGEIVLGPGVREWLPQVQEARVLLSEQLAGMVGVRIEPKSVAVAVHWRGAPDLDLAQHQVEVVIADIVARTGLSLEPGKLVQELRPPLPVDKGTTLRSLIHDERLEFVAYAGDDRGDLPAFTEVLAANGAALIVHGHETAPQVAAVPGTHFDGPEDFAAWLEELSGVGA